MDTPCIPPPIWSYEVMREYLVDMVQYTYSYILFIEKPAEFRRPLKDMTDKESGTVTLECELNKPNVPVKWLKDGEEIKPDDHIKVLVDEYTHKLVLSDVTLDDTAKYSCVVDDVSTEANLTVEGTL